MIDRIRTMLGDESHLLDHECKTISKEHLHLPGPDFVDRVVIPSRPPRSGAAQPPDALRPRPARRAPATCRSCRSTRASSTPAARPSRRIRTYFDPENIVEAGDRGRLQRRRVDARRARRGRAQVRAQDPVHPQVQPQRAAHLPQQATTRFPSRSVEQAFEMGAVGGRRDDLLRLGRVAAGRFRRSAEAFQARPRAGHGDASSGATCATPPSRRTASTTTPPPT